MTRAEFLARFPNASEASIRANCTDFVRKAPTCPTPCSPRPVKAKQSPTKRVPRVARTRNAGTWTEAEFWSRLRSCLRRMSVYWKPARSALLSARTPFHGPRGQKWAFLCASCGKLHPRKRVHLDHTVPCGQLTDYAHVGPFLERLLPEDPTAYRVLCHACHQAKTNVEREASSSARRK